MRFPKRHKYGAQRTGNFSSKLESAVHDILVLRERAGEITDIKCQVQVELSAAKIIYKPDFSYVDIQTGVTRYAEAKGFVTPEFNLKKRLWKAYGPGPLEIYKGDYRRPSLAEIVESAA